MNTDQGLDAETLGLMLDGLKEYLSDALPPERQLELDHEDICPEDTVRAMSTDLGIQLVFVPEAYGGMGGGAFDSYLLCEVMARKDIGLATAIFATFLGSDPILVGATEEQKEKWLGAIAEDGIVFAYGATEPEAGSDLGAMKTKAVPIEVDGEVTGYRISGAKQWISNGTIADATTILALAPGGPTWFVVEKGTAGLHQRQARGQARDPAVEHRGAVPGQRRGPDREPDRRRRGQGPRAGPAGLRLHPRDGGRVRPRRRLGGRRPRDRVLQDAHLRRVTAGREAGLHPQADRPARRPARGRARVHRGDLDAHRRRRGPRRRAEHRGRDRQVPGHRVRQPRRRGRHPGPRRLRLHPRVRGREDQARRADHHDLRGHLGDPRDDDRPRPLAGAPEVPRRLLPDRRAGDERPARPQPAGRGRRLRPGVRGPGRRLRGLPGRSAHPQPARAVPPRRAGGQRGVRRRAVPARRGRCGRDAGGEGQPALRRRRPGRHRPGLRPRGGDEGRRGGHALGHRLRRPEPRPGRHACRPRCGWTPSAPHRPVSSPT